MAFLSRAFGYLSGLIVLALAGVGATSIGMVILAAYAARTLWSLFRVLRPVRPRLADYVVDVLAPVATGLIVGHEPSFVQLDDSGAKGFELGLAIVTRLVDAMDGTIAYEPSSLGGASFVVTLPKPEEPHSTEASQAA